MNWKNTTENLGISIATFLVGALVCYLVMSRTVASTTSLILEKNNEVILEALKKETTSIKNEFNTEIKKLKNRKGELTLDVKPVIENQIEQNGDTISVTQPQPEPKKKRGFLGRLFGKKNKTKNP